jgi:CDP-diacylglycerol--glycerol-3-phosphate 3-phosphatidyltransferase
MTDSPTTFTDRARALAGGTLARAGGALHRAGIHPDTLSLLGFALVLVGAVLIGLGRVQTGGLVLLLALPLDALDGAVARAMQRTDPFGGLLDSTLDRYADGSIFAAVGYYFASQHNRPDLLLLALAALVGSFSVSYVRARAGEAGLSVKVGLFSRLERSAILLPSLLLPDLLLVPALVILAVGTNITAFQRLWFVYKHTQNVRGQ